MPVFSTPRRENLELDIQSSLEISAAGPPRPHGTHFCSVVAVCGLILSTGNKPLMRLDEFVK
jgi:hypothetical protein